MAKADRARTGSTIRCAIYTRKSSDEASRQEFNSLDAQRELPPPPQRSLLREARNFVRGQRLQVLPVARRLVLRVSCAFACICRSMEGRGILKQSHSTQTKRKAIAIMRRSYSDSLLTASQMDGVFGSDKWVTEALERLMEEDAAADRPFIAALAISKARGGLPGPGFFDCARRLGRFAGDPDGQDARTFHAAEPNAFFARRGVRATTDNEANMSSKPTRP